ncbi:hypothetical protein HHI36_014189 [Cryptolaemus montrouzieri]|uniref:Uncharacterized protein n=1 Tax=Cryptolaemus montrouzieri TaxID=559131 RepID=A0ABD2N2T3_9CUCU
MNHSLDLPPLNESEGGTSDTEVLRVRTSNSADSLISPETVRPFPKASPRKLTEKRREGKTTIITETHEKGRFLLENMMNISNKKTPKAEKLNLKHVKQIFKGNLTNKESSKKKKTDTKKCAKASQKKEKVERKFSCCSSNSDGLSYEVKDSDTIDDISGNGEITPR